jgi:hypothetical protein
MAESVLSVRQFGNNLQRQLVTAGLRHVQGARLNGCTHWIYEENLEETPAAPTDFLAAAGPRP